MPAWLTPVIGIIGVIIGVGITEIRQWMERKEKYQTLIFERRLKVHQEAYSLCYRLELNIHLLQKNEMLQKTKKQYDKCVDDAKRINDWWLDNCLYLDKKSQEMILNTLFYSTKQIDSIMEDKKDEVLEKFMEEQFKVTLDSIAKGVGVKYLPEIKEQLKSV